MKSAQPNSTAAIIQAAVRWFAKAHDLSFEEASAILRKSIDTALIQEPKIVGTLLGVAWRRAFEVGIDQQKKRMEQKSQHKLASKLASVDLTPFMTDTQSGYKGVYKYGTQWCARVKVANKTWQRLPPRDTPEEAAFDRYQWCLTNSPEEVLPENIRAFYVQYKSNRPEATHEEALEWAKDMGKLLPENLPQDPPEVDFDS